MRENMRNLNPSFAFQKASQIIFARNFIFKTDLVFVITRPPDCP